MRHRCRVAMLGRPADQRKAMLRSLTTELIRHGRITTTLVKAKAMRPEVERMVTLAKSGTLSARRQALGYIYDKDLVHSLFEKATERYGSRNGGYTRVVKLGRRLGDSAEIAILELVDWNESGSTTPKAKVSKPRPTRRTVKTAKPAAETPGATNADVADLPPQE